MLHPYYEILQKKKKKPTVGVTFFFYVFWTSALALFSKIKSDLIDIFSIVRLIFYTTNSLN